MGNRQGITNPCAEIPLGNTSSPGPIKGTPKFVSTTIFGWTWRIKKIYGGIAAPAGNMMYACEAFGLITETQCDEGMEHYSNRIHARHMKRQQKKKGTKKRWTREFRNNKFKW